MGNALAANGGAYLSVLGTSITELLAYRKRLIPVIDLKGGEEMAEKKVFSILEVKLRGECYSNIYAEQNIQHVCDVINDVFDDEINIEILEIIKRSL